MKICYVAINSFVWDIVVKHFGAENVQVVKVPWPLEDKELKKACWDALQALDDFDILISFWNGLFLRKRDFQRARLGAINVHPAPPEHPGLGMFSYPRVFPEKRSHHGATLHEIDAKLDNGRIYMADRFDILPQVYMTDHEFVLKGGLMTLKLLDDACAVLAANPGKTTAESLGGLGCNEQWGDQYFSYKMEEEWLKALPEGDPRRHLDTDVGRIINVDFSCPPDDFDVHKK